MKKIILASVLLFSSIFAKDYMAKIEPFEKYEIKSETSGVIKFVDKSLESTFVKMNQILIEINSDDEKIELQKQKESLAVQNEIVKIREKNYNSKNRIVNMSRYEKNNEKLDFLESKKELVSLKQEIKRLKREINKKTLNVQNRYIHNIYINKDEYVNQEEKLFDSFDISKQKITLYLSLEEIESLSSKRVFIDGKESSFKVHKVSKVKDEVRVSRYKVEFIKNNKDLENYFFDKIVKVQLK